MADATILFPVTHAGIGGESLPVKVVDLGDGTYALATSSVDPTTSDQYVSVVTLATSSGTIPVGALSWKIFAVSGTVTVSTQALALGSYVGGGGYGKATLKTAVAYAITSGSALVAYDTLG